MAEDPEFKDIQDARDLEMLNDYLIEATKVARDLRMNNDVPAALRVPAFKVEMATEDTWAFTVSSSLEKVREKQRERLPPPGVFYAKKKKGEVAKEINEFANAVKKDPAYSNVEFKCIGDFEKCQKQRGKFSALCALAFFICMGRRIIPLVQQTK